MARQPFYGRGPGPQIARMDMQAATAPGRAYGQMYANLGKIAGDSIEKYAEGKKKKEEQKQTASFIKRVLINSPETAAQFGMAGNDSVTFEEAVDQGSKAIAKDPKGFEIVKGFAAMADQRNKARQEAELFELRKQAQKRVFENEDEQKDLQRGLARFQTAERDLPITPELMADPDFVPPPLDPDPFVAPPRTYKGQAPGVERLPESFQPQGQRVIDAINEGDLTPMQGNRLLGEIEARAIAEAPERLTYPQLVDLENKIRNEERAAKKSKQDNTEFDQGQSFLTFTPKSNFLMIRGQKVPVSGLVADQTVAKELKTTFIPNFNHMDKLFSRLMEISAEEDYWDDSTLKSEANALVKSIQGQMREEVLGPGTVTDSERAILNDIVQDPFVKGDNLSSEEAMASLSRLRTQLTNKFQNKLTNVDLQVGQGSGASSPSKPSNTLDDGTTYDFDLE